MRPLTSKTIKPTLLLLQLLLCALSFRTAEANLLISEVAPSGTSNACNGEDWVELLNDGDVDIEMTGFLLTDDRGFDNSDAEPFYFPDGFVMPAGHYLLMCGGTEIVPTGINGTDGSLFPLPFGIGSDDTIQLILAQPQDDGSTSVLVHSTAGPFPKSPNKDVEDVTYAWDAEFGVYNYTATPTPGEPNVIARLPTKEEQAAERKAQLAQQNDQGIDFFNFDRQGLSVPNTGMDPLLNLKITMDDGDWEEIQRNPQYMEYKDFQTATVSTLDGVELLSLNNAGRIRTRGQEATYMAVCLGSPPPFRLDFDRQDEQQTLFGVQRVYLRHPLYDQSYTRGWAYPRMLARFGLPHVRTRMVDFYINENLVGTYTLMEIPDEEYAFARNFPDYDPKNFAFFQTTPLTEDCGQYTNAQLELAMDRVSKDESTPPYAFERGEHNGRINVLGSDKMEECKAQYQEYYETTVMDDVVLAYLRNEEDCAEMFLKEGLIDQELGTDNWDKELKEFVPFKRCEPDCENSELAEQVDVENFLKMLAFYAVVLNIESPLGGTNNYYMVQQSGDDKKWKLVSYEFENPGAAGCTEEMCNDRLIHWSILRPTCEALEENPMVGPLFSVPTLRSQYLGYVQEFLDGVYADASFIEEIQNQISAIGEVGTVGASFDDELSPDAASWDTGSFPLLPTMKARAEDVRKQLAAIDDGTYPRGMEGSTGGAAWETCADWQLSEPDASACEEGCKYDGCHMDGQTVESYCKEATGICYQGDVDQGCEGVVDGDKYGGMDAGNSFCRYAAGVPIHTSECPAVGAALEPVEEETESSTSRSNRRAPALGVVCSSLVALASPLILFC